MASGPDPVDGRTIWCPLTSVVSFFCSATVHEVDHGVLSALFFRVHTDSNAKSMHLLHHLSPSPSETNTRSQPPTIPLSYPSLHSHPSPNGRCILATTHHNPTLPSTITNPPILPSITNTYQYTLPIRNEPTNTITNHSAFGRPHNGPLHDRTTPKGLTPPVTTR